MYVWVTCGLTSSTPCNLRQACFQSLATQLAFVESSSFPHQLIISVCKYSVMVLRLAALDVMSVCFFLTSYTVTGQKFLALHSSSFQATYCTYSMCVKAMMQSYSCLKLHVQFTPIQAVMCAHFQHKPVVLNVFPSTCFPLIHTYVLSCFYGLHSSSLWRIPPPIHTLFSPVPYSHFRSCLLQTS